LAKLNKQTESAVNEFDQALEGNSLTKDAWKRLKKNKMAVISIFIVAIYAFLSIFASILPIYSYRQIILDHQHLRPSLTKTAGELMVEKMLKEFYFSAYRDGRIEITPEQQAKVDEMSPNQKWDFFYEIGTREDIPLTAAEQRKFDNMLDDIATELQFDIKQIEYTSAEGSVTAIEDLSVDELTRIYSEVIGYLTVEQINDAGDHEIRQQLTNEVKVANQGVPEEEMNRLIEQAFSELSEKDERQMRVNNLVSKIRGEVEYLAEDQLSVIAETGEQEFPLTTTLDINDEITATVKASKLHDRRYLLGTDYSGRDMLSRIIYGGQVSIAIGFIGTITSVLIGIVVGAFAGYLGGKVDYILMRIVDVIYGLPYMLLVIIMMAVFGRNILNLFFALAIVSWLTVARMVRGQIISLKNSEFVEAARSMGASTGRIIFRHLVPNSLSVIIVFSTLRIPAFIMMESFLSFLGLGVQAPYASWGALVGDAVEGMSLYPWRLFFPALAMTLFLFAMNFLGDGLRDAFDPQSKNQL
jgi:oligopeptide transport system permease protein